jgi:hypothetical protein
VALRLRAMLRRQRRGFLQSPLQSPRVQGLSVMRLGKLAPKVPPTVWAATVCDLRLAATLQVLYWAALVLYSACTADAIHECSKVTVAIVLSVAFETTLWQHIRKGRVSVG